MKIGDEIITKLSIWHMGEDIGNRLGKIISTESHVLVHLYNFHSNPVKLFRHDVEKVEREISAMDEWYAEDVDFSPIND